MTSKRITRLAAHLPSGLSEIYFHPASCRDALLMRLMPDYEHEVEFSTLTDPEVHAALNHAGGRANMAFLTGDYTGSLRELAALRAPVDAFFNGVMVNAEDPAVRHNRLALLAQLQSAMNRVADLSRLE